MAYDRDTILGAWKKAVNQGIIDTNVLRPEVARSWRRCMSYNIDPWSTDFPTSDSALLQEAQEKHAALMQAAAPVLQYLLTVFNCNASLADMHGFVFDLVTPLSPHPWHLCQRSAERERQHHHHHSGAEALPRGRVRAFSRHFSELFRRGRHHPLPGR